MSPAGEKSDRKSNVLARRIMVGLVMTCVALMAYVGSLDEHLELMTVSLRQKALAKKTPINNVVNIDIDDASLESVGRWPWPREYFAGVVETLKSCGAKTVVWDIILPNPQQPRYVSQQDDMLEFQRHGIALKDPPELKLDDLIFEQAIEKAGNVYLPIQIGKAVDFNPDQLAQIKEVGKLPAGLSAEDFFKKFNSLSQDEAGELFIRYRALQAIDKFAIRQETENGIKISSGYVLPPFYMFADKMAGTGFVDFKADSDSVVRRMSLLARNSQGKIFPQIAFAVSLSDLGNCSPDEIVVKTDNGKIVVELTNGQRREIPLDEKGRMILIFARDSWRATGTQAENHLPISAIANLWEHNQKLAKLKNKKMELIYNFFTLAMGDDSMMKDFKVLDQLISQRNDLILDITENKRDAYHGRLFGGDVEDQKLQIELAGKNEEITKLAQALMNKIRADKEIYQTYFEDEPEIAKARIEALARLPEEAEKINKEIAVIQKEIRSKVAGKICLIGTTAIGAADFAPTPLSSRTPGVVVHSNIINMILSNRFITPASWWQNFWVIFIAGFVATVLASNFRISFVCVAIVLLGAIYYFVNMEIIFLRYNILLNMVAPIGAMLLAFIGITAYRELTEVRAKRHIRSMFAHALSPQLVNELLADPSIAQLGGQDRPITCMFTDLAGFTSLSEKLGPKQTVAVLNRYFDCVTTVVQEGWGGYINKFLGDGVFAFFGAPVAQEDHADRSLRAAIEYQDAVVGLNSALSLETGLTAELKVRIGLTTDKAMVGNCGSTQRMDYTAIGNVVNLAARLEAANKFFGSKILAEQNVVEQAGNEEIIIRMMPKIYVNGVAQPVRTYNIVGIAHNLSDQQKLAAKMFTEAVELLDAREFQHASDKFMAIREMIDQPDKPLEICIELCSQALTSDDPKTFQPADVNSGSVIRMSI